MADHRSHGDAIYHRAVTAGVALALLAVGVVRHYGYKAFPPAWQAWVWNMTGAAVILCLMLMAAWRWRSQLVVLVAVWWTAEELFVIGCNGLWLYRPWIIKKGQDVCYPLLDFDIGKLGVLFVTLLLLRWFRLRRNL